MLGLVASLQADERIRIVAANLTSGNAQSYDAGHGGRILQGLQPDVVLVQEFNYLNHTTADLRAWVDANFGASFSYMREPNAGQIPNGVVSRYPILASGKWEDSNVSNRDFAWARIDIPGDRDLWVISVHLLTTSASNRNAEASQILNYITAQGIPAADYVVLGGDFNTVSNTEACIDTLSSYFVTSGSWPVDQAGNGGTNRNRDKPYDRVLADTDLNARKVPVVLGSQSFPNGLVFDSRVYSPLPSPVLESDSAATNMQHMAVVRDFMIPTTSAPAVPAIYSAANASGTAGQTFSYQIAATNTPTTFGASGLPSGLSVNTASGLISGTPAAAGNATVSLSATNASGTGTATLALTIVAAGSGGGGGQPGVELLREDFAALTTGSDTSSSGPSGTSQSTFAPNFPSTAQFFPAGGTVKLGSGSNVGSMTSKVLNLSGSGGAFTVSFKVKGWTAVEGDITVTVTGLIAQTVTYTNTLADGYVTKTLNFTGGTTNSTVTIATTAKRAFIDDVVVASAAIPATPTLATSGTLAAVNTIYGTASSTPTSFSVSGADLTAGILVTPPAGFEVSQTTGGASGYASTQTVGASGTVASTTIYVRLAASTAAGNYVGVVTCSSVSASSATVPVAASTVARRSLVVTAQDRSKPFGEVWSAGTSAFTASGLVSGQTIAAVVLSTVGGTAAYDAAGSYSIFPSNASGGSFTAANYSISYVQGTLTVTAPTFAEWADGLADATPAGDPDGDGMVNLLEYYQGLDPEVSDGLAPQIQFNGAELSFEYRHSKTANGVTGAVEWTTDLAGTAVWSDEEVTDELIETFDLYELRRATVPVTAAETKKFLRLRISQP
ncbi:endonuclease/exonuclease/phosphatase family protein [Rariglobus hedericola]